MKDVQYQGTTPPDGLKGWNRLEGHPIHHGCLFGEGKITRQNQVKHLGQWSQKAGGRVADTEHLTQKNRCVGCLNA